MKEKLFILDSEDNLLTVTTKYIRADFEETVEKPVSLTIEFPMNDDDAELLVGGNQVAFHDLKGDFRLFDIREVDDDDGDATEKIVECLPAINELQDVIIEEKRPQDKNGEEMLGVVLENSRWKVGKVEDFGTASTSFYFDNALDGLKEVTDLFGGEIVDRIEIDKNKIVGRYIDLIHRKGRDTGKRFEMGKDIKNIVRTVLYYPKTALYGKGSSLETEGGGHSRKITFRDVEWSKANGDPTDKPKGQEWVGDDEAREERGIFNPETNRMEHRFDVFEDNDEKDPEALLHKTWNAVQETKKPQVQYEMDIITYYDIAGYEHEQVFLGDSGIARDKNVKPMIIIDARIVKWKYDIGNPKDGQLTMGNILDLSDRDSDIDWVVDKVKDESGNWDAGGGPITDEDFPDVKPDVPQNVQAEGLFRNIVVKWDFESTYAIANYEVFASQQKGFRPDGTTRVFRGKTGRYNHEADTDEKWYFRVRAVNTHGTPSDFSDEVSASTVQLELPDLEHIIPDFIEYSIYEGDDEPSPDDYKYWLDTSDQPYVLKRWDEETEKWIPLSPIHADDIGAVDVEEYQQKVDDILSDLEDKADAEWVDGELKSKADQEELNSTIIDIKEDIADKADLVYVDGQLEEKVDEETYEDKIEEIGNEISGKADLVWVDGKLKDKANKDTTYTKEEVDNQLDNKVSSLEYQTDKEGFVERFEENETQIKQNEEEISSKVSQTEYDSDIKGEGGLKQRVSKAETEIVQNAEVIESKASRQELDSLNESVKENESSIKQNAEEIESKVSQKDFDGLSDDVTEVESTIKQHADMIEQRVTKTEYSSDMDGVINELSIHESLIEQNEEKIASKVEQTEFDSETDSLSKQISNVEQTADSISQEVTEVRNDLDDLEIGGRNLIRNSDFSKGTDDWEFNNAQLVDEGALLDGYGRSPYIQPLSVIPEGKYTVQIWYEHLEGDLPYIWITGSDGSVSSSYPFKEGEGIQVAEVTFTTEVETYFPRIRYASARPEDNTEGKTIINAIKLERGNKATDWTPAPEEIEESIDAVQKNVSDLTVSVDGIEADVSSLTEVVDEQGKEISDVSSSVEQNAEKIEQRVTKTEYQEDVNGIISDLESHETRITQTEEEIESKVSKTEYDELEGRVSNAESSITQNAEKIESKVSSSEYEMDKSGILEDLENHESRISQTEEEIKSTVKQTEYEQDKESLETSISENKTAIEQNAESIESKVSSSQYETDKEGILTDIEENRSSIEQNAEKIISKVDAEYVQLEIDKIDVGNRNMAIGTSEEKYNLAVLYDLNVQMLKEQRGEEVTISFEAKFDTAGGARLSITVDEETLFLEDFTGGEDWEYYEFTRTLEDFPSDAESAQVAVASTEPLTFSTVKNLKVEKGNKATDWIPSPEDTGELSARVVKAESIIEQQADEIELRVEKNGVVSSINQSPESIKIDTERLDIKGVVNFINEDNSTGTLIDGNRLISHSVTAEQLSVDKLSSVSADIGSVTAGDLRGVRIFGAEIYSEQIVFVGDDLTVTNNINLGSRSARHEPKRIYFNDGSSITGGAGDYGDRIKINSVSMLLPPQLDISYETGHDGARIESDYNDNNRLKLKANGNITGTLGTEIWIDPNSGNIYFRYNNKNIHTFYYQGTKSGGSIEVDGTRYGMSPVDSPRVLLMDMETDVEVDGITTIYFDDIFKQTISNYAVFPNNPDIKIIDKNKDGFTVQGHGIVDFLIYGTRIGSEEQYFFDMED